MKVKKILALISAMALAAGTFCGCGMKENTEADQNGNGDAKVSDDLSEHVEITIGGINVGANSDSIEGWPTEVVEAIEKKFNITLKLKPYDNESLNLDLSGGTTCDIVQVNDDHIAGVLKGKHAVDLEQYADSIAANINSDKMNYRNQVMKQFKSNGDNKLYFVTPHVTFDNADINYGTLLNQGYQVRWDLYKAIGCPEINNDDDYIAALKAMKEIYPETEDGLPVYGLGVYNDMQLHAYFYQGCLSQGYANLEGGIYVQNIETNELVPDLYDVGNPDVKTPFWSGMEFYNKLYREGLLDPDCFITKGEDLKEKYTKGQYLGGIHNWYTGTYNENQKAADPETLKEYITLPCYLGWANEHNAAGWIGKYFFVSSHSPNIERAVMVLDYLQSGEFTRMINSGVEGRWEMSESGKAKLTDDTIDMKVNGNRLEEWKKSGILEGNMTGMAGEDDYNLAEDGARNNLWYEEDVLTKSMTAAEKDMCETLNLSLPSDLLTKKVEEGTSIDMANYKSVIQMGLEVTPKNIVRIDSNCEEITMNAIPNLVQAETDEEFAEAKKELISQLKDAGAEESVEWWMNAWEKSQSGLEKIK